MASKVSMDNEQLESLCDILKCGEYDGIDIMFSEMAIQELISLRTEHEVTKAALQKLYDSMVEFVNSEYSPAMSGEVLEQFDYAYQALKPVV